LPALIDRICDAKDEFENYQALVGLWSMLVRMTPEARREHREAIDSLHQRAGSLRVVSEHWSGRRKGCANFCKYLRDLVP
jgi:hypothetical protein